MERTTANSSITPPTFGNQSETGMPDFPYCLKVRRMGITGRFIVGDVVAEADGVDQLARVLVVLRIEGIDVADAAAHEQEDDRFGLGLEVRAHVSAWESFRPPPTSRRGPRRRIRRRPGSGSRAG